MELSGQNSLSGQLQAATSMRKYISGCLGTSAIPTWALLMTSRPSIIFSHLFDSQLEQHLLEIPSGEKIPVIRDHDTEQLGLLEQLMALIEE